MVRRLYIHNFKCLVNFELELSERDSTLLIGKNGTGKSSVRDALSILQNIARGVNRVGDLINDGLVTRFAIPDAGPVPTRFELEVELDGRHYRYELVLDRPESFREHRVLLESLACDRQELFTRSQAQVSLQRSRNSTNFQIDWHLVALPLIQENSDRDPLFLFKRWLARSILLEPRPSEMSSDSDRETLLPESNGSNFAAWFSGLMAESPASWNDVSNYLKEVLPDLVDIKNPLVGRTTRSLEVQFQSNGQSLKLPFGALSDGEKCYFLAGLVVAAKQAYGPLFCFWDEADAHLSLSEVGHFVLSLRRAFQEGSQLLMTSHNAEAIRHFGADSTYVFQRRSHLEPTQVRPLNKLQYDGNLIDALIEDRLAT